MILANAIAAASADVNNKAVRHKRWPNSIVLRCTSEREAYKCLYELNTDGDGNVKKMFAPLSTDITIADAISDKWEVVNL